jgi:creatinine amidohydrolase
MKIGELTSREFEEKSPKIGLLPTGSNEQHGPHDPLATDSLIAESIAESAATDTKALLLPAIRVGVSREHSNFAGTLYLSPETFRNQLTETIISAGNSGLEKFVIVNGHGGNISAIQEACQGLHHEHGITALEWTWFNAISTPEMGHAGELETSLIMYLREELVKEPIRKGSDSWGHSLHGASWAYDTSDFSKNGVVGDPTKASREKGEKLFSQAKKKLVRLIEELSDEEENFV